MSMYGSNPAVGVTVRRRDRPVVETGDISHVKQSFRQETDINAMVAKYRSTGLMPAPSKRALFGDFSSVTEFQKAQNVIARGREQFDSLPASVRRRFSNDPSELLKFVADPANRAEGVQLGLFNKPVVAPGVVPGGPPAPPVPVSSPPSS